MKIKVEVINKSSNVSKWLDSVSNKDISSLLNKLGNIGVDKLKASTPKNTGELANGWYYKVERDGKSYTLSWLNNSHSETGTPLAIMLYYGHGTGTGGWVNGFDYISDPVNQLFSSSELEKIYKELLSNG